MLASFPSYAPAAFNYQGPGDSGPNLLKSAGYGELRFVDSTGGGTTASGGRSPENAHTTIESMMSATYLNANKAMRVVVLPGHAETITAANGIDLDIAGTIVEGIGYGSLKPTITLGTATTASLRVNAANITLRNFRFVGNIDSLVKFIDVNANYCTIEDCDFVTSSAKEATSFINLATTIDYLTVRRCRFEQPTDPTGSDGAADTGAIYIVDSEFILIEGCWFSGNFETAIIHNRTTACKNLLVRDCYGQQDLSGAEPFQLVAGATGGCWGGHFNTPAETAATEATLVGTLGNGFFISPTTGFGNDGGAGGQGGIIVATAS